MPAGESTAFFKLLELVENTLNPPGKKKREALMVPEAEWEGIDAWLEAWRGRPWTAKSNGKVGR